MCVSSNVRQDQVANRFGAVLSLRMKECAIVSEIPASQELTEHEAFQFFNPLPVPCRSWHVLGPWLTGVIPVLASIQDGALFHRSRSDPCRIRPCLAFGSSGVFSTSGFHVGDGIGLSAGSSRGSGSTAFGVIHSGVISAARPRRILVMTKFLSIVSACQAIPLPPVAPSTSPLRKLPSCDARST
jgi:hypothetical protein